MIELNDAQRLAIEGQTDPVEVIDPQTNARYVLVRADVWDRVSVIDRSFSSRQVRVAGRLDFESSLANGQFTLRLTDGNDVVGIAKTVDLDGFAKLRGEQVVVSGRAFFDAGGALVRVETSHIAPARPADLTLWSKAPRPLYADFDAALLRQPQGPTTGINAILGQWPGNETDEEIEAYLEEIS